jgi:hypothetical protein
MALTNIFGATLLKLCFQSENALTPALLLSLHSISGRKLDKWLNFLNRVASAEIVQVSGPRVPAGHQPTTLFPPAYI